MHAYLDDRRQIHHENIFPQNKQSFGISHNYLICSFIKSIRFIMTGCGENI
jgi:hypothetical protein